MNTTKTLEQFIRYRRPLVHKRLPVIVLWSHKAGCTNFTKWFFYQMGLLDEALKYQESVHAYRVHVYYKQRNYNHLVHQYIKNGQKDRIKLVRNPYNRAVSSFLKINSYCFRPNPPNTLLYHNWEDIHSLFNYNGPPYKGISFKQYLQYLEKIGATLGKVDGHIAQQYIEGEESIISKYIRLENFKNEVANVEKQYGLRSSPAAILAKSKRDFSSSMRKKGNYAEEILTREMLWNDPLPTHESFHDQETMELCQTIFKRDFEMFGYDKNHLD